MVFMIIDNIQPLPAPSVQKIGNINSNVKGLNNKSKNSNNAGGQVQIKAIDTSGQHERSVDDDALQKSIEKMLKILEGDSTSLKFDIHKDTNTIMVKVIDNETQKVVREIPSEKILDMIASIWKLVGIIVDKKA
jgi:flagellar protein FlaG